MAQDRVLHLCIGQEPDHSSRGVAAFFWACRRARRGPWAHFPAHPVTFEQDASVTWTFKCGRLAVAARIQISEFGATFVIDLQVGQSAPNGGSCGCSTLKSG